MPPQSPPSTCTGSHLHGGCSGTLAVDGQVISIVTKQDGQPAQIPKEDTFSPAFHIIGSVVFDNGR